MITSIRNKPENTFQSTADPNSFKYARKICFVLPKLVLTKKNMTVNTRSTRRIRKTTYKGFSKIVVMPRTVKLFLAKNENCKKIIKLKKHNFIRKIVGNAHAKIQSSKASYL